MDMVGDSGDFPERVVDIRLCLRGDNVTIFIGHNRYLISDWRIGNAVFYRYDEINLN